MSREILVDNTDLKYVAYYVVRRFKKKTGRDPTGLYFNKAMSLINTKLREDGYNLRLPHCWYRWGDEVVRYYMPFELSWNHEDPPSTTVTWEGDVPREMIDLRLHDRVKTLSDEMADQFSNENISEMVEQVYMNAPFDFQRLYKKVRDSFLSIRLAEVAVENFSLNKLIPQLEKAIAAFPEDSEFDEVREHLPAFKSLMMYVLSGENPDYGLANEISEELWFWFCYFLRLHPRAHENIGKEALAIWTERLEVETDLYLRAFGEHVLRLSRSMPKISIDAELAPFVASELEVERESDRIMSEFEGEFDGLDTFLEKVKGNYKSK